jgi:hypothetical protein
MSFSEFELKPMAQFEALCGILWICPYVVRGGQLLTYGFLLEK